MLTFVHCNISILLTQPPPAPKRRNKRVVGIRANSQKSTHNFRQFYFSKGGRWQKLVHNHTKITAKFIPLLFFDLVQPKDFRFMAKHQIIIAHVVVISDYTSY